MKRVFLLFMVAVLLVSGLAVSAQDDRINCDAPDYSAVEQALAQADQALNDGDLAAMFQAQAQAKELYRVIGNKCVLQPIAEHFGLDEATVQQLADAPSCQYVFDATVRTVPDTGANVHGTLSLLQNTDTSAVGYVFPDAEDAALVPVKAEIGADHAITLTFTLPDGGTIVGTGTSLSSISTCYGAIVGDLTGPAEGDVGDWVGATPVIQNCAHNPNYPCMLNPTKPPKPDQPPSGGICDQHYDPVCNLVCDANNANCHFECQDIVGATCNT